MKVAVLGAGTMGRGIAQVFAQGSHDVFLSDSDKNALPRARKYILDSLGKLAKKGIIRETPESIAERITFTGDIEDTRGCNLYVEAIFERPEPKMELLRKLGPLVDKESIVATNTSSISINFLSSSAPDPSRFIGLHFFNPVPLMNLVEIVQGEKTSPETLETALSITRKIGKDPVVSRDFPGFISNRILMPILKEAMLCFQEGVASAEDIDKTAKLGFNHPMGPLELSDFIGLDVVRDIMEVLYHEFGEERFKPPIVLRNMVNSGLLGRKSGAGFYRYSD
jgi:3-hydroxybutyryl-CoA dehydrogenase